MSVSSKSKIQFAQPISQRLAIFIFAFAPVFVLLSLRDETLFFFSYTGNLLTWSKVEGTLFEESERERIIMERSREIEKVDGVSNGPTKEERKAPMPSKNRTLRSSEIRTALIFLFLLHVGFFGTGE